MQEPMSRRSMEKYGSIQLMRGIAALAVMFVHIPMFFTGSFGVDLFFCISGFIMMHVTERDAGEGWSFLMKRAIRIVPLYWIATAVMCAILYFIPSYVRTAELRADYVIKSLLFIPIAIVNNKVGTLFALYGVGWTLVYEAFFYLLFFVSMKISHKRRDAICTAILVFFVAIPPLLKTDNEILLYYSNSIILEFALGMLAYRLLSRRKTPAFASPGGLTRIFLALSAALLLAGLFVEDNAGFFGHGMRLIRLGLPTFLFFLLVFTASANIRLPRWATFPGDISYSLYLVHYFVIHGFSRMLYSLDAFSLEGLLLIVVVIVPLCLVTSWVSWWLVEVKFCGWLKKKLPGCSHSG